MKRNNFKKSSFNNRRKDFRLEIFNESAVVTLISCDDKKFNKIIGKKFTGYISNLSVSGLKLLSEYNLPIKCRFKVRVEFTLNKTPFIIHAYLLRKEEHIKENLISYGFQFIEMDRKVKEMLTVILHKIEAERRKKIS